MKLRKSDDIDVAILFASLAVLFAQIGYHDVLARRRKAVELGDAYRAGVEERISNLEVVLSSVARRDDRIPVDDPLLQ